MIAYVIAFVVVAILSTILWRQMSVKKKRFPKQYSHDRGRPIGQLEDAWRLAHDMNGSLILANTLVLRSKKPIQASVVKKAMERLMKRHPMLRMCIKKNPDEDYWLRKMENVHVDLRQLDSEDWRNVMEESLLEKFDVENGPLWRVSFLPNVRYESETESDFINMTSYPHECFCIFAFHHIIIDGTSYSRMFAEFINFVAKLNSNEEPEVTSMPMLPPLDVYTDEVVPFKWYHHLIKLVLEILCSIPGFPALMSGPIRGMNGEGNPFTQKYGVEIQRNPQIQPRTKIIPVEFTKDETSSLLKKCKEHQTTVQGAVQTAAGVAMVTMLEKQEFEVETNVTVNSRPFFKSKVPNEYVGPYLAFLRCKNKVVTSPNAKKFWSMAKSTSEDIHAKLKKNEHMEMSLMFYYMSPLFHQSMTESTKDDKSGRRSRQLVVFTNLGYCKFLDGSPDDDVILRARFGCSAEHQQGHIFANNLATFSGKLFWTFVYYSNITSDATAQRYVDLVKETILKAIS